MTYENEIFFTELVGTSVSKRYVKLPVCGFNYPTAASQRVAFSFRVMVQCSYPVAHPQHPSTSMTLHSDTTGIGIIMRTERKDNSSKLTLSPQHTLELDEPTGPLAANVNQGPLYVDFKPVQRFLNRIRGQYLQGSSRVCERHLLPKCLFSSQENLMHFIRRLERGYLRTV